MPGSGPYAGNVRCRDFVENLVRLRNAYKWSQAELAAVCAYSSGVVANIESFQRPPLVDHGRAIDVAFGLRNVFEAKAKAVQGESFPLEFGKFSAHEETAVSLHVFGHSLVPGLVQTEDYARAILSTRTGRSPAEVERLVAARMGRQAILTRDDPDPPLLWVLVDESVLGRPVAAPEVMYGQCMRMVEASERPNVRLAVVSYRAAGHSGLLGAFVIAKQADGSSVLFIDDVAGGRVTDEITLVRDVTLTFETLQAEAMPTWASREVIERTAEGLWNGTAATGARALAAATTAESA